jgi:hypothetical protein
MRLGDIGIGRKIYDRKSGIMFRIAGQDHYGEGITTLLTDCVIGVRALDAAESGPQGRYPFEQSGKFGNNNYPQSNLNQWLNSDKKDWYTPTHELDNPPTAENLRYGEHPYLEDEGFLCRFSETFRKNLVETDIPVIVRTDKGKGELTSVKASVFLPSRTEMNKGSELDIPEGKTLPIFYDHYIFKAVPSQDQIEKYGRSWNPEEPDKGLFYDKAQMYDPKFGWWYYMRTPSTMYKFMERVMSPYGSVSFTYANNDVVGLRPLVNLNSDLEAPDVGVEEPIYRIG